MKKLLTLMLTVVCVLCFVFGFTACGGNGNSGNEDNTEGTQKPAPEVIAVTEVKLDKSEITLQVDETQTLIASVLPENATNKTVTWKSSNKNVVSVKDGKITGVGKGEASVTATAGGKSSTCLVNVEITYTDFVMPEVGFDIENEVEITFYHTMGGSLQSVLEKGIEAFNAIYPNIKINHERIGGYGDVFDTINSELLRGKQPDIAYCYSDHIPYYNLSNAVQPLDAFLPDGLYKDVTITRKDGSKESLCLTRKQENDYIKAFYDEGSSFGDGNTYTLPFSKTAEVMFYNKTFFDKYELKVPTTWDEMEQVIEIIKLRDPESTPLAWDSEANMFITMCAQHNSPYTSGAGELLFDNATNRAFVQKFKNWYDNGYFASQSTYGSYTSGLFVEQQAYMSIGTLSGASHYNMNSKNCEVGVAMIPQADLRNPKVIAQGPSVCLFKQNDPQRVLASWLFVKFLTTNTDFQTEFSISSRYLPVIKSVVETPMYMDFVKNIDAGNYLNVLASVVGLVQSDAYFYSPAFVGSDKVREEVGNLFVDVLKDKKTLDNAFKDAVENCKTALLPKNEE